MIAGAVAPPRIDLLNKELIEAHLHSVWLGRTGLDLQQSIADVLDTERAGCPLSEIIGTSADLTGTQLRGSMRLTTPSWQRSKWVRIGRAG